MEEFSVIGKSIPRTDAWDKVIGRAVYTDDMKLPNMLYGKILRSSHAHARILNVNIKKALQLPGVKAIMTGKDILPIKYGIVPFAQDEYGLAIDKVRYVGDEVAAVAAVDQETADAAIELIEVEYELLPAVFTIEDALKPGAPDIHDGPKVKNNVSIQYRKEFGNIEQGFADAYHIREDIFRTHGQYHAPMEPHAAIAMYEPSGKLTLWSSTQIPYFLRHNLASTLGIAEDRVRVIKPTVGGGFGVKIDMYSKDFCAAFLSMKTGRPVKFLYDREEAQTCVRGRHPAILKVRTGVFKDGRISSQHIDLTVDGGAYNSTAPLIITLSGYFGMIPYYLPNLVLDAKHVYTNKQANGAMRGHGANQMRFAIESQADMLADDLGMDAVDFRRINALEAGSSNPADMILRTCGFKESLDKAAEAIGWKEKRGRGNYRGVGVGGSGWASGVNNMSHIGGGAVVKLEKTGGVSVMTGAADIGQGAESVIAQIVAEELGVSFNKVRVIAADTDICPLDSGTFGSGVTVRSGKAAQLAARDIKKTIIQVVAKEIGADPEEMTIREDYILLRGERKMQINKAVKLVQYADIQVPMIGRGYYQLPAKEPTTLLRDNGDISGSYSFGTQACEVEVDPKTGQVTIINIVTADDAGRALNPDQVEGQIEGAVMTGVGHTLYEDPNYDLGNGQNRSVSFIDYKLPTAADAPPQEVIHVETNDPVGPFGAKECGEGATIYTAPAIVNAITDAIGIRIMDLPITPEKILKALEEKNNKGRKEA